MVQTVGARLCKRRSWLNSLWALTSQMQKLFLTDVLQLSKRSKRQVSYAQSIYSWEDDCLETQWLWCRLWMLLSSCTFFAGLFFVLFSLAIKCHTTASASGCCKIHSEGSRSMLFVCISSASLWIPCELLQLFQSLVKFNVRQAWLIIFTSSEGR